MTWQLTAWTNPFTFESFIYASDTNDSMTFNEHAMQFCTTSNSVQIKLPYLSITRCVAIFLIMTGSFSAVDAFALSSKYLTLYPNPCKPADHQYSYQYSHNCNRHRHKLTSHLFAGKHKKDGTDSTRRKMNYNRNSSMDASLSPTASSSASLSSLASSSAGGGIKDLQIVNKEIRKRMASHSKIHWQETRQLMNHMLNTADHANTDEIKLVHDAFRQITTRTFSHRSSWHPVEFGLQMMDLQVSSLGPIPRPLALQALKSLNVLMRKNNDVTEKDSRLQANAAFRILQRLCTGVGIQQRSDGGDNTNNGKVALDERDFSMVLNGFVNIGDMKMARRVVGLQLRTEHAPPLSPVVYSILIKGYGRLRDIKSVDLVLIRAKVNKIDPDIIMYNSLIDAYINCDDVSKAYSTFKILTKAAPHGAEQRSAFPTANLRTYNIMLKGFVRDEDMDKALLLSKEMDAAELWDAVTTNTLVGVAVATKNFDMAESILKKYTVGVETKSYDSSTRRSTRWHPNVEAYTELVGGYAKSGRLAKAMEIFKAMKHHGVNPNEYTYTSIIGALAKANKIDQAKKMLSFMTESDGITTSVVTYNAFFTGMLDKDKDISRNHLKPSQEAQDVYNKAVDDALELFDTMLSKRIHPNEITLSLLVDALGNCKPSRVEEAKSLIAKMDVNGFVASDNARVATTLIRACAHSSDLEGALAAYCVIGKPDVIAFNALLNAFCEGRRIRMAIKALNANLKKKEKGSSYILPDVVTYTILISSLLKVGTEEASKAAYKLYKEMRNEWQIIPDTGIVDA